MTRKLYSEERLVVRRLVKDEHRLMVYDAGASCGKPMDVGDAQCEMLTLWEKCLNEGDEAWTTDAVGDSMVGAGINAGDTLLFVETADVKNGDIVLAYIDEEPLVKHFYKRDADVWLVPNNPRYEPIHIDETMRFRVAGVLRKIIKDAGVETFRISRLIEEAEKKLPFVRLKSELPAELCSHRAKIQLTWLMENDLLDDGWMPVAGVPVWKLGGIADRLGEYFGLDDKWKFFSDLWDKDRNYMRTKWNEAKNMAKEKEFSKNILCRIR